MVDSIPDQTSKKRPRLTLCSASSSRHLPPNANIPQFTHPSSQTSQAETFRSLPRPQKEKKEPKPRPKAKPKSKAASDKVSTTSLRVTSGSGLPTGLSRKLLGKAKDERKKKDGPLEEAEQGFYNSMGFWEDGAALEEWKLETTTDAATAIDAEQQPQNSDDPPRHHRVQEGPQDTPIEDNDADIAQELINLHNIPSSQPFESLFERHEMKSMRRPPTPHQRLTSRPQSLVQNRVSHSTPAPRFREAWGERDDGSGRLFDYNLPSRTDVEESAFNTSAQLEPEIPMPPSAQLQRRKSKSAPAGRAPPSRLRYSNNESSDEDEEIKEEQSFGDSEGSLAPMVKHTDQFCSPDEPDSEAERMRMSPTEMNSSNVRESLARSSTRRSNSRQRLYSVRRSQSPNVPSSPSSREGDLSRMSQLRPDGPSSFAVSDSESPTQMTPGPPIRSVANDRKLNTYSKSASRIAGRRRREIVDPDNPAHQPGFRDQFSPEPEWEYQQRRERRQANPEPGIRSRSKRRGSTSLWPDSFRDLVSAQSASADGSEDDGDAEDEVEETERQPLREVRVNERGRVIARGRGRNGAWPGGRDLGLFGEGDDDNYRPRPDTEGMRPVTERLHLVHVKVEVMDADEEVHCRRKRRREDEPDRIRAFPDPRYTHPIAKLKLTRSHSVQDRLDGYTSRLNTRHRHDRLPYKPGVNTNGRSRESRRRNFVTCDDLPPYVLKPIERIPIDEYRQQLKTRIPHDGFINDSLVKAGRLAARDELLVKQRRIRSTGNGKRTRAVWVTQTPIVDDNGVVDEIVAPTQTQRSSNLDPINNDIDEHQYRGFTARHRRIKSSGDALQTGTIGRLRFTAQAPKSDQNRETNTGLSFTQRSPPRTRTTGQISHVTGTHEDEHEEMVQPAPDMPELAQPRVGYMSRFKGKQKRVRVQEEDDEELQDDQDQEDTGDRGGGRGFIRKVEGFWAPPAEENGGWMFGDPIQEDNNQGGPSHAYEEETIDHPDGPNRSDGAIDNIHDVPGETKDAGKKGKTPLFFAGEDILELTISNTVSGPSGELTVRGQQTTDCGTGSGAGLSGVQLCNDLLLRNSLLSIPIIPGKSTREAKRDERAKRILRKQDHGDTSPITNSSTTDHEHSGGQAKDQSNQDQRDGKEEEMGEEIVAYQPISSQIRARRRLEEDHNADQEGEGYRPRSSQIRRRAGFGIKEPGQQNVDSQSTQAGPIWDSNAFDPASPVSDPTAGDTARTRTQSLHTTMTRDQSTAGRSSKHSSAFDPPPGNQAASKRHTTTNADRVMRPPSRTRSAIQRGFVPPMAITKSAVTVPTTSQRSSGVPRWATINNV